MAQFREFAFKKFGHLDFKNDFAVQNSHLDLNSYIKIVFVKAGGRLTIDFEKYTLQQDAFFFINAGQHYQLEDMCCGCLLFYNRDFYCVEIHDKEVACDGILFHNVYAIPAVLLDDASSQQLQHILQQIRQELHNDDTCTEEMLRILLKQIIINCTRRWKQMHRLHTDKAKPEVEFTRTFSQLVEWHYTRHHTVAAYAEMLHISPKTLNSRITRFSKTSPNEIIKSRILLEAKRLLAHTDLQIKEIGYRLGYEDPSYFVRLFTRQESLSPQNFRKQYQQHRLA